MKNQIKEILKEIKRLEAEKPEAKILQKQNIYIIKGLKKELKYILHIAKGEIILDKIK